MKRLLFLSLILFIAGCRSVGYDALNPKTRPNQNLLLTLDPKVNDENLEDTYTAGTRRYVSDSAAASIYHKDEYSYRLTGKEGRGSSTYYKDERVKDAERMFYKEVKNNIIMVEGKSVGNINLILGYRGSENSWFLKTVSWLALGTLNVFGFPYDKVTQRLEVEVEIKAQNGTRIKRYVEENTSHAYLALYYGYTAEDAGRKISADNLRNALKRIRAKINADANEINKKLTNPD